MKFLPIATSLLIGGSLAAATSTSNPASSSVSSRSGSSKAARAMAHEAYEKRFPEIKKRCSKKKGSGGSSNASGAASSSGSQSTQAEKYTKTGNSGSDSSSGSQSSSSGSKSSGKGSGSSSSGAQSSGSQGSKSSGSQSSDGGSDSSASSSGDGNNEGSGSGSGSTGGSSNYSGGGDMSSKSGQCGSSDASSSSPNGSKSFLNCGVDSGGWKPANVKLSDLKIISDEQAASSSVFQPCQKYASEFKSAASSTGIPAAILMSIAMQESTCNANANGSRGEVGMMQITSDKCDGAPGGNCHDTEFNIKKGGSYLKSQIDAMGGNFLAALGGYNGWYEGMKASGSCGPDGQNLNYLNGMLNGFAQGKDGYGSVMGAC